MISSETLGKRLKFFRERARISQFELENRMSAANGMISRIEKGKVNPTRNTIQKIGNLLNLNRWEYDYLFGNTSKPPTETEIKAALEEVEATLNDKHYLGYLADDRWQFIAISKGFEKIFNATQTDVNKLIGNTIIECLIDSDFSLKQYFDEKEYEALLELQLKYYYLEVNFMYDDPIFQRTLKTIMDDPLACSIWDNLTNESVRGFLPYDTRTVNFKVRGITVPMRYSREPLLRYPRFEMLEYKPVSRATGFIMKLLR